jgi:hypothetical protein
MRDGQAQQAARASVGGSCKRWECKWPYAARLKASASGLIGADASTQPGDGVGSVLGAADPEPAMRTIRPRY